jgi:hypothetical protein
LPTHIVNKEKQNVGWMFHRLGCGPSAESDKRKEAFNGNVHGKFIRLFRKSLSEKNLQGHQASC